MTPEQFDMIKDRSLRPSRVPYARISASGLSKILVAGRPDRDKAGRARLGRLMKKIKTVCRMAATALAYNGVPGYEFIYQCAWKTTL